MKVHVNYNLLAFFIASIITAVFIPIRIFLILVLITLPFFIILFFEFKENDSFVRFILSFGIVLILIPIFTFLFNLFNVPLNEKTLYLFIIFTYGLLFFRYFDKIKEVEIIFSRNYDLKKLTLIAIILFGLFTRVLPILNMNAPLFFDPAVDGTITRMIIDNQGLVQTWEPFLDIELNRRTGLPSIIAWITILSGEKISEVILYFTNLIYVLLPIAIYGLSKFFFNNDLVPIISSIFALIAAYPSFMFISGMNSVILIYFLTIVFMYFVFSYYKEKSIVALSFLVLFSLGMFPIHPNGVFYLLLFLLPVFFILYIIKEISLKKISVFLFIIILLPVFFYFPYILSITTDSGTSDLAIEQWEAQSEYITPENNISILTFFDPIFMNYGNDGFDIVSKLTLGFYSSPISNLKGYLFMFLFLVSVYFIVISGMKYGYVLLLWYLLVILFGPIQSVYGIRFPGWQYIYPTRVNIFSFLPISLILGYGFSRMYRIISDNKTSIYSKRKLLSIFLVLLVIIQIIVIYDHMNQLSRGKGISDNNLETFEWIDENLEEDILILNMLSYVEPGGFVGGPGQWIPALINKSVFYPPIALTEDFEAAEDRLYVMDYIDSGEQNNDDFKRKLNEFNITHIYVPDDVFGPDREYREVKCNDFADSHFLEKIYYNEDDCFFQVIVDE